MKVGDAESANYLDGKMVFCTLFQLGFCFLDAISFHSFKIPDGCNVMFC